MTHKGNTKHGNMVASTPTIHRSFSSPTLRSTSRASQPQSLNEQLRGFADKFVDVSTINELSLSRTSSASGSTSSINGNNSFIISKIGYNTPYCKHRHSCFQNCWARGVVRTFAAGYITRTTWSLVSNIIQFKLKQSTPSIHLSKSSLSKFLRSIYFDQNSLRFALGLTILSFTYKFCLCFIFRRLIPPNTDTAIDNTTFITKYIYPALSGFIAGFLSLQLVQNKATRSTVALFCIVRAIGDLLRVLGRMNKLFVRVKHFESIIFILFQIPIMYAFMHRPSLMNKTYFKWILTMGSLSTLQMHIVRLFMKYPNDNTYDDHPLLSCQPVFHETYNNCFVEHTVDWFYGIFRAARIYIPVHWLPTILLTPKKILDNPLYYFKIKSVNTLRSSLFLTTYQYNMKLTQCVGRRWMDSDAAPLSMIGGIAAGCAILIEHKSRRSEIVLYVIPRAIEIILNLIPDSYTILSHDMIPVVVFSISLSLWMAIRQCDGVIPDKHIKKKGKKKNICNDLNMTVLSVVCGRFH
eukprot:526058_1